MPENPYRSLSDEELAEKLMTAAGVLKEDGSGWSRRRKAALRERLRLLLIAASWRVHSPEQAPQPLDFSSHDYHRADDAGAVSGEPEISASGCSGGDA